MAFLKGLLGPPDISKLEAKGDVNGLIEALRYQKDEFVRCAAVEAVANYYAQMALAKCTSDLANVPFNPYGGEAEILSEFIDWVPLAIIDHMISQHSDKEVRRATSEALAELSHPVIFQPLLGALGDLSPHVRLAAVEALGKLRVKEATQPLIALFNDFDSDVRVAAAEALERIGWQPEEDEDGARYWIAKKEIEMCALIGEAAIEPLLELLADLDTNPNIYAIQALAEIGSPRAVEPLIAMLSNQNFALREAAIEGLAKMKDATSVDLLLELLENVDQAQQVWVITALGRIGDPRAVEPILAVLRAGDKELSRVTVEALGKIGDAQALDALLILVDEGDKEVRIEAIKALGKIGGARAVDSLLTLLHVSDPTVRQATVEALGQIRDPRTFDSFLPILRGSNLEERITVIRGLAQLGDARAVEPLLELLKNSEGELFREALAALAKMKSKQDFGAQIIHYARNCPEEKFEEVFKALPSFGWKLGKDDISARYYALTHNWVGCVTVGAPAVGYLIRMLGDGYNIDRREAAKALVSIYKSSQIDQPTKQRILAKRDVITSHTDRETPEHYDQDLGVSSDCTHRDSRGHFDEGNNVEFPI